MPAFFVLKAFSSSLFPHFLRTSTRELPHGRFFFGLFLVILLMPLLGICPRHALFHYGRKILIVADNLLGDLLLRGACRKHSGAVLPLLPLGRVVHRDEHAQQLTVRDDGRIKLD